METNKLIIKTESIDRFFNEFGTPAQEIRRSMYHLMQDEIIIKQPGNISIGNNIEFHLEGKGNEGRFDIEHVYLYEVSKYDDISYKLVLKDFKVTRI